MPATISQLAQEIIGRMETLPAFINPTVTKAFSIFNMDDLQSIAAFGGLPIVGVSYEGASPIEHNVVAQARGAQSSLLYTVRFSVVIAIEYASAAAAPDPKPDATNLLDETRAVLLGYKGVNSRSWRLGGEGPVPGNLEGVVFYGQMWETDIPVVGNHSIV
jgi:hypothetical protein